MTCLHVYFWSDNIPKIRPPVSHNGAKARSFSMGKNKFILRMHICATMNPKHYLVAMFNFFSQFMSPRQSNLAYLHVRLVDLDSSLFYYVSHSWLNHTSILNLGQQFERCIYISVVTRNMSSSRFYKINRYERRHNPFMLRDTCIIWVVEFLTQCLI